MNAITSPELLAQVNPDNKRLKDEFLGYLKSVNSSPGTIRGYSNDLDIFFVWVLQYSKNKEFSTITKRDYVAFQNWLMNENGNSPARIRRIKAAISSMSNYVEDILDDDPDYAGFRSAIRKIKSPALKPVREKTVWDEDVLEKLLSDLIEQKQYEKACYVALGMFSGRRKSELARFKVSDFDDSRLVCNGGLYKSAPIKTKGLNGGKIIPCYTLAKKFKPYFDMWMNYRRENGIESEWLLPSSQDPTRHVSIGTLNSWADTFSKMTGQDFYAHSLRHYFTTSLKKAGFPDSVIQTIVDWESSDMVRLYTDINADDQIGMYFNDDGDISVPNRTASFDAV